MPCSRLAAQLLADDAVRDAAARTVAVRAAADAARALVLALVEVGLVRPTSMVAMTTTRYRSQGGGLPRPS